MNWSSLLPSLLNRWLNPAGDVSSATHSLRDTFIFLTFGIALVFALLVLWQTWASWRKTRPYLKTTKGGEAAVAGVLDSQLPLFRELRHHLIEFSPRDGTGRMSRRRTVDAAEVFRESALAPPFSTSRLFLGLPGILTGLGVLGTFVGLQLGIGSLDLKNPGNLDKSIVPLIEGCAVAFSSSVWGVFASLIFSGCEKFCEGFALRRVHRIQIRVDALFPRYVPEEAMSELERTSRGTEDLLKGLAVAIGAEMQQAIGRLGAEIKDAVSTATAEGHGPLMEKSAELLSTALTTELVRLKEQIGTMSEQFSQNFTGASDGLMRSVQGFQPTVEALSGAVGAAQRTVTEAVTRLNGHETVMQEMTGAATNIREAAEAFGAMRETLATSAARNEEAAKAQLAAAQVNEAVADQFGRVGEGLPDLRQTLEDAARVIGSLGAPIADLHTLLKGQPELERQLHEQRATSESERGQRLLAMSGDLAEKVGRAAAQFAEVGALADKLTASAANLERASGGLAVFGQQVLQASKEQRDAAEASRTAALSGERTARAFEPLPGTITQLTSGLQSAGMSVRSGAEAARDSYRELVVLQKQWFAGAELGLTAMKERLQAIIASYGSQIEGQTSNLMNQWTTEVVNCLGSYSAQVDELQGGLDELQSAINRMNH